MKKINLVTSLLFTAMFFSCQKQQDDITKPAQTTTVQPSITSQPITWDQLPDEFKNATRISSAAQSSGNATTARSTSAVVASYGPYGSFTGTGFTIAPPHDGYVITGIGIGNGDGTYVNTLIVWYRSASGTLFTYQAGVGNSFVFHQFAADEYVKSVSGGSSTFLNRLTINTNKTSFTAGGAGGAAFSATALIGDWFLSFRGRADKTRITQIYFDVYCKPWQQIAGSSGRDIAVAADGTAYLTNSVGNIYKMAPTASGWTQLPGSDASRIAANANRICMVNSAGKIYELFGSSWKQLLGSDAIDIAINSDSKIWMVNSAGKIYQYNDINSSWSLMSGSSAARIAAGGNMVWLINSGGNIFRWNGSSWTPMPGSAARDIAVSNDGSVWLTNASGLIYNYDFNKSSWNELSGSDGVNIAVNNQKACMVNTVGKIYKLTY